MTQKTDLGDKAKTLFSESYNCSQSVLLAMCQYWGIKNDFAPKIATGFGGGMGRTGSVCGAVTGAVMALGVWYGTNEPSTEKRLLTYEYTRKFLEQFEKMNGGTLCRDLIGYTLADPNEYGKAVRSGVFQKKCPGYVETAVKILLELTESCNP
jgi:C_GCAxxG_C_C family probable redox protein